MSKPKSNAKSQFIPTTRPLIGFEPLLGRTKPQACSELIEAALSQLECGLPDMTLLYRALSDCELYSALLRRGSRLVNQAISPGEVTSALHKIAAESLAAGWIAHESGIQSALLTEWEADPPTRVTGPRGRMARRKEGEE
jgi:hypothetical protein